MQHKIYSPPFVLSAGRCDAQRPELRLRQLQAGPVALPPATADPMAPQSAQLSATPPPATPVKATDPDAVPQPGAMGSEECKRQDLRFNFGQGAEARCEVLSMGVPQALQQDMPMYDEPDSGEPVFATPWQAMGGNQPAMEAKDFLPDGACEMGMCDTMLPGCREAQFKSLYFPRLVFNFSRPMYYENNTNNSQTTQMIKEAMAWAFSAMPEAIQVALQELEQREKELKQQTAVPNYGFGNYGQPNQQNQYGFNAGQQNNWFNQPQASGSTQQMPQAFGKWWNTQRRLTAQRMGVDSEGHSVEMPSKLMSHQAEIRFQHGLPYRITHDVVRKMIKQGMIPVDDGKSKDLGDLNIIGFYLDEDLGDDQISFDSSPPAGWAVAALAASAAVAALLSTAVAVVVLRSRWHTATGYEVPLQAKEPEQCEVGRLQYSATADGSICSIFHRKRIACLIILEDSGADHIAEVGVLYSVALAVANGAAAEGGWRDKDPPPQFSGEPEDFKEFLRDLEIWRHETEIPSKKHGAKLIRSLRGPAKAVCNEIEIEVLLSEAGYEAVIKKLKEFYQPHMEQAMPRAFERAIYGEPRKAKEGFGEFVVRQEGLFRALAEEGIKLEDTVKGYVLFRQSNLSAAQEDQITTWTQGTYGRAEVIRALRKLEKVTKEKSGKHYMTDDVEYQATEEREGTDEDSDGEYVYIGEHDLSRVYDEKEISEALATYQQVRRAIKDQKNSRGYFQPKGAASAKGGAAGSGKGFKGSGIKTGAKGTRVHVDLLKLRTRCARCGQVGHWARECANEPDARAKAKAESSSSKTGFFEVGEVSPSSSQHQCFHVTLGQFLSKNEQLIDNDKEIFTGLATDPTLGIVDTAAQGGLIGKAALDRLQSQLKQHGLRIKWSDKVAQAKGIGGEAQVVGVAEIPVGVGGINGLVEVTVVQEDVPFLLSIKFLKEVQAVVDLFQNQLEMRRFNNKTPLIHLPSGHVAVDVMQFSAGGWIVPTDAPMSSQKNSDFRFMTAASFSNSAFMLIDAGHDMGRRAQGGGSRDSARAVSNWRKVMDRVADLMEVARAQARVSSWQSSGSAYGSLSPPSHTMSARYLAHMWPTQASQAPSPMKNVEQQVKSEAYGELIKLGVFLGIRKCKNPAEVSPEDCGHPVNELCGAGNQSMREVWCKRCYARWMVDPTAMDKISKKEPLIVNGKHFQFQAKVTLKEASTPKMKSPPMPREVRMPLGPRSSEESVSAITITSSMMGSPRKEVMCKCGLKATQLQVRKEGPTQGRLFWKCTKRVCDFFLWDPQEQEWLQQQALQEKEDAIAKTMEAQEMAERQQLVQEAMDFAETRHHAVLAEERQQFAQQLECMKNQLCWMSAVAGEDRIGQVFQSPEMQEEAMRQEGAKNEGLVSGTKMETWLQENAPRACILQTSNEWDLWASKQFEDYEKPESHQQATLKVWYEQPQGGWQFHHGILPSFGSIPSRKAIGIFGGQLDWMDGLYGLGEERALSRGCRKGLNRSMATLKVAEVYSPPRVSQAAEELGHQPSGAFDLNTGYDLSTKKDRLRCWKQLRDEDPDLVVVCPPCGPFSILQGLNQSPEGQRVLQLKLAEGREHLKFAMQVFEWQVRRKKLALFEHPSTSKAWKEEEVERALSLPGVVRIRADLCQFGMAVKGKPNKKPTDFMLNGKEMARRLERRCKGEHEHQQLMGGLAKLAEKYPLKLCQAMIKGAEEDLAEALWTFATQTEEEDESADLMDALDEEVEKSGRQDPSSIQISKAALRPDQHDEALRMARAKNVVWRYVKEGFQCPVCAKTPKPRSARPAQLPKNFEPCKTVGLDVVYFPALDVRSQRPVLNMVDWGTGYQMLEPLYAMTAQHIWEKFYGTWVRTFGIPQVVIVDQGREFGKEFASLVSDSGSLLRVIGARAPWQQGKTERHGGLAKEIFDKVKEDVVPASDLEWRQCIHAVEAAKNRLFNRSGFSPAQRQFGYNMRLPASLGSDDEFDPAIVLNSAGMEMQRLLEIKHKAMEAFIKQTTSRAVAKAQLAKHRVPQEFAAGDVVYVYRVPLQRKRAKSDVNFEDREGRKATWVGPGVVVMLEGANAWLSIRGELWKCAREQLRKATPEEEEAKWMLDEEFEDLKIELSRKASKRGFRDITEWERPPPMMEHEESEEPPRQRPRIEEPQPPEAIESDGYTPTSAAADHRRNEQLDGTPLARQPDRLYAPNRELMNRVRQGRWNPYQGGAAPNREETEEQASDDEEKGDNDLWLYDEKRGTIVRMHNIERAVKFTPSAARGCPIPVRFLGSTRRTIKQHADGRITEAKENWRSAMGKKASEEGPSTWWVGYTEFKLRKVPTEVSLMVKRGSDEVLEKDIPAEEWEAWRVSDAAEWSKVEATGAVKVLTPAESKDVEEQLRDAGLTDRILPSRVVRRWKPSEQPGIPPTRKSRWCVRGDKDPDLLELSRHAPTVTTSTLSVVLQIGASKRWKSAVGDLRNAFMQSDALRRAAGRLFCRQPTGGLPTLQPDQLIEILASAYGLGDAPAHWRRSLKKVLFELGFQQSSMDPCVYKWFLGGELAGLLVVEVDDLFAVGNTEFFKGLEELRKRFQFGKFAFLQEQIEGSSFNGRRIRQKSDFGFQIDMEKFVTERLETVKLERGRLSNPEVEATEEEKNLVRAAVGSLTWAAKEGRPDAAATASLTASNLNQLRIKDIIELNKGIQAVKERPGLTLQIQGIPFEKLCWGVVTDASYANAPKGKSQGAFAVIAYEESMTSTGEGKCHILHWRSGKIHRVVNSTLAAETQSLSRGLAELTWTVTVFNEFVTYNFNMKEWEKALNERRLSALVSEDSQEELKRSVCIVDAKSLYDHLSKETVGTTSDKRTALEMQVIRQVLSETHANIKWVPHPRMIVDGLTKRGGNLNPLYDLIDTGRYRLFEGKKKVLGAVSCQHLAFNHVL
ncbi:unnamed protein product [Cladocopium goreaui]|uniref:Retrovirus-related Pol polyprotein from transposon RE1 (Retro element 1) (AtRE1) n=1 Tax=Cladocopium goreaui TaxID=2562237 RepID=A0A9P1G4R9_9DINO|nr:unnamed protein product [Cladocopium goreaui]